MSAFQLSDVHFAYLALVHAAQQRRYGVCTFDYERDGLARLLKYENTRSVAHLDTQLSSKARRRCEACPSCGAPDGACEPQVGRKSHEVCPFARIEASAWKQASAILEGFPPWHEWTRPSGDAIADANRQAADVARAVHAIKSAQCYEYQSNEHPAWTMSRALEIIESIKSTAIKSLPGYDAAPWGLS